MSSDYRIFIDWSMETVSICRLVTAEIFHLQQVLMRLSVERLRFYHGLLWASNSMWSTIQQGDFPDGYALSMVEDSVADWKPSRLNFEDVTSRS